LVLLPSIYQGNIISNSVTVLTVFVASPSDLENERAIIREEIEKLNEIFKDRNLHFRFSGWEQVSPDFGDYPQQVINEEIGDDYDIFIGMIANKYGSKTPVAGSGTEEEFNIAYERYKSDPDSLELKFYFKDAPVAPSRLDPEELVKIKAFKKRLREEHGALTGTFSTDKELSEKILVDLSKCGTRFLEKASQNSGEAEFESVQQATERASPTANLEKAENDSDEVGYIDVLDTTEASLDRLHEIVIRISGHSDQLLTDLHSLNTEADGKSANPKKKFQRITTKFSRTLRNFADRMAIDIRECDSEFEDTSESMALLSSLSISEFKKRPDNKKALVQKIETAEENLNCRSVITCRSVICRSVITKGY